MPAFNYEALSLDGKKIKGTDKDLGGTMRLGSYEAKLKKGSLINFIKLLVIKLKLLELVE